MSSELESDYITGKTVYFLLRNSAGRIWNGAAFEVYVSANYATYPVTATEQGTSGYYAANMPAVAADVYNAVAKDRAGGAPAETDLTIADGEVFWDGSIVGVNVTVIATAALASIFRRAMSSDEAAAAIPSLCSAILKLTSKFSVKDASNANKATTYRTDGVTVHMTQIPVTDSSLVATKELGVGS